MYYLKSISMISFLTKNFRICVFDNSNSAFDVNAFDVIAVIFDWFAFDRFASSKRMINVETSIKFDAW